MNKATNIVVRRNRKFSTKIFEEHSEFRMIRKINSLGEITRVEIRRNSKLIKQYSGLLHDIIENCGTTTYLMIDCNNGEEIKIVVKSTDKKILVTWRKHLIDEDEQFQFVPLDKNNNLTSELDKIKMIKKIEQDELRNLINKLYKGGWKWKPQRFAG